MPKIENGKVTITEPGEYEIREILYTIPFNLDEFELVKSNNAMINSLNFGFCIRLSPKFDREGYNYQLLIDDCSYGYDKDDYAKLFNWFPTRRLAELELARRKCVQWHATHGAYVPSSRIYDRYLIITKKGQLASLVFEQNEMAHIGNVSIGNCHRTEEEAREWYEAVGKEYFRMLDKAE